MILKRLAALCFCLSLLLLGCTQQPEEIAETAETNPTITALPSEPAPTLTPEPTVPLIPTATAEPTAVVPAISVSDQNIDESGIVQIESVTAAEPGWVVVFADQDGRPASMLGFHAVAPGTEQAIEVTIDPYSATETLHAGLHLDEGSAGEFDYPGEDAPVQVGSEPLTSAFNVEVDIPLPAIEISDQAVAPDGLLTVESVFALSPSWLVIYTTDGESLGETIGQVSVDTGENDDLVFPIRWQDATLELTAVLHEDPERPGGFDPSTDRPVLVGGAALAAPFAVQLPPDILAYDQPVVDGTLTLEQVILDRAGWVVVYNDNEGQPGLIIGFEPISAGISHLVRMEIVETAITPQLYLSLHEETSDPSEFDFPAADPPALYADEAISPTILRTNPGNYLLTVDQTLNDENEVIVPLVVTDLSTWLVIYSIDEEGQPADILGRTWLPAGISRDVAVSVNANAAGQELRAMLHQDGGEPEEFEYPDGDDVPLQRNRQIIVAPFFLADDGDATGSP